MILSDVEIEEALKAGEVIIEPAPLDEQYAPSALDLTLGDETEIWEWDAQKLLKIPGFQAGIDLSKWDYSILSQEYLKRMPKEEDGTIKIPRNKLILAVTKERLKLRKASKIAVRVEGRSSLARLGLMVHFTAPTVHCTFSGNLTLELLNLGPFDLFVRPNETRICQIIFERLGKEPRNTLDSQFQDQESVKGRSK